MKQGNKTKSYQVKKTVRQAGNSKKINPNHKTFFLSKFLPTSRRGVIKLVLALLLIVVIAGAIPLPHTFTKSEAVSFADVSKDSAELELGDSKVIQEGRDGTKTIEVRYIQSTWGRLFGWKRIQEKEISSTITTNPIDKIIANGTRKYQYMLCTDGSYRFYADEEFKNPNTGFTSKSEDYCNKNGQGVKLKLADSLDGTVSNPATSSNSSPSSSQSDTSAADEINRETEKLLWCSEQDKKIGDEYITKVHQAQARQGITNEEFNAIVEPAYYKYSYQMKSLNSSGCDAALYPDYTRQ